MAFKKIYYTINNSLQRTDLCKNKKEGFTIVELMIAISVFSVVMIIATTGILLVARQYQSGVTKTAMQSATRDIHQKISDSIKYGGGKPINSSGTIDGVLYKVICAGNTRYYYVKPELNVSNQLENFSSLSSLYFQQQTDSYTDITCGGGIATNAQQLLPNNAKVTVFNVDTVKNTVDTTFIKGDEDLFNLPEKPAQLQCKSGVGNQWCSVVSLSSIVNPRL